ncbi:MAG TPA: Mut7-C RNAse domain-containing protein [Longimicrobium sp.]|nr:Mut7-C RNAse domain-containing protein [Longimicrobium sp.]
MADVIPCPGCARPYDRERFAEGRAVRCTCGARVGEARETGIGRGERPRFAADAMLGRLARWLRALGYDTGWDPHVADPVLVRRALEQRRVILTRDVPLAREWRLDNLLFIHADDPLAQLGEVAAAYPLDDARIFSLCTRCNATLHPVSAEHAGDRVPDAVHAAQAALLRCPSCERVYWEGSHTARMRDAIARILAHPPDPGKVDLTPSQQSPSQSQQS